MRLIDAESETLIKQINLNFGSVNRFNVKRLLHNAPTVDAVPVVRCKDCDYYLKEDETGKIVKVCLLHKGLILANDNEFCSYGERRE